jgi:hypothetical protein
VVGIAGVFELRLKNWVGENRGRLVKVNRQELLYLDIVPVTCSAQCEAMVVFCSSFRQLMMINVHQQRDTTMVRAL